jgi:hypothetical protein
MCEATLKTNKDTSNAKRIGQKKLVSGNARVQRSFTAQQYGGTSFTE